MRAAKINLARRTACAGLALWALTPLSAASEPVLDRVFSNADVVEKRGCSLVRIGFNFRVRYVSHFPLSNGTEVRIDFRAIDPDVARADILTRRESLRVPANKAAAIRSIEFEAAKGAGLSVLVAFERAVHFEVAQGGDFESFVMAVSNGKSKGCKPVFPDTAGGSWNVEVSAHGSDTDGAGSEPVGKLSKADRKSAGKALSIAQKAMSSGDFAAAIRLATKVLELPESELSPEAKELLGLARERNGQLAHAQAEYEEYLERYPDSEGAARVRKRLAGLTGGKAGTSKAARRALDSDEGDGWSLSGSLSQFYIRDEGIRSLTDPSLPPDPTATDDDRETYQNELLSSLDVNAEWRIGGVKSKLRASGAVENGFEDGDGNIGSVAAAYLETAFSDWGLVSRIGRQTRNTGGVVGRFDGGLLSWQVDPALRFNVVGGSPVKRRRDLPFDDNTYFYGLSADIGPFLDGFDTTVYAIEQRADDMIDRQAVGVELRYADEDKSAFGTVDYDVAFGELNLALATGRWTAPDKSTFSVSADYRKSPFLVTSNALQGQIFGSLADMQTFFTDDEIEQLALDRTATATTASLGFSRPLNEMLQINLDATIANLSSTPASGGVDAMESTGLEYYYSALLLANGVFKENDSFTLGLRFADRETSDSYALDIGSRYPVTPDLRVSPTLRFSYREGQQLDQDWSEYAVMPSLRLNYRLMKDFGLDLEAGAKWSQREEGTATTDELEYFFLFGYHYDFFADSGSFGN